jgi:hypothetical protein
MAFAYPVICLSCRYPTQQIALADLHPAPDLSLSVLCLTQRTLGLLGSRKFLKRLLRLANVSCPATSRNSPLESGVPLMETA